MADTTITENDDDELIPTETPPADDADADDAGTDDADDDVGGEAEDEDDGDDRLAESEDDHEEEIATNRKRRQKRREVQKKAKERAQRELEMLRQQNAELLRRVSAVEGHVTNTNVQSIDARFNQALAEVRQAEAIIAKATEAGNGEDVVAAMRIRDAAIANAQQLQAAKQQFQAVAKMPKVDPAVASYAQQWLQANPWYDPKGGDRDSALTKAIDNELAREGYDPKSREYWEELTNRVSEAFGTISGAQERAPRTKRKTPPPTGASREHAPASTKKEIYVTPERKQAMIEAGVWDDPAQRQRYLKAYQAYDKSSAR